MPSSRARRGVGSVFASLLGGRLRGPRRDGAAALAALLALALASAGCAGWRPKPATCAAVGAVAGAAAGAAVGNENDWGTDGESTVIGGAAGGILLGAAGYTACRLAQAEEPPEEPAPPPEPTPPPPPEPEEAMPAPPEEEVQERIVLRGVHFDFDEAEIRPEGEVILSEAARILSENPGVDVRIEGHTDATGPESYNQRLSEWRARAVEQYLVDQGIAAERLTTRGFGESRPVASNETRDGRALNRRVELSVVR